MLSYGYLFMFHCELILNSIIPDLESEMYQLSHLLTEQRSLLAALASTSLLGSTNAGAATGGESTTDITTQPDEQLQRDEEERRRKLTAALEKVEGCVVCAWVMHNICYNCIFKKLIAKKKLFTRI